MIPWEVSTKFEQFKPLFQILKLWKNTMLAGILSQPPAQWFPKFENLKSWHEIVQNSLKLQKLIIKYLNLFIGGVLSFEFEKVCI
jgi:hypothetical protein